MTLRAGGGGLVAYGLATLSAFFNGSFPVASRFTSVPLDPVLFNGLVCLGVFLSSLLVPLGAGTPYVFTVGGMGGGILFVFAALLSFLAIPRCGLATAQAVWSVSAIAVSFAWGAFGPAEVAAPLGDLNMSLAALALLLVGAAIAVSCEDIAKALRGGAEEDEEPTNTLNAGERATGVLCAGSVGLFGGSVLVPFKFVPPEAAGLAAVPSFGLGALLAGVLVTAGYWSLVKKESGFPSVPADALFAGLAGGLIWNLGNVCSIVAQSPPFDLSYGVAYPILQCALFFGGLWGIFVFGEIKGAAVQVFWTGAALLAGGIVLLSQYGPGATG